MTGGAFDALACGLLLALTALTVSGRLPSPPWWPPLAGTAAVGSGVTAALESDWWAAVFCALALVLLGRDWWNRGGRRAARELGAKARALLDALTRRWREAGGRGAVPQEVPA